MDVSQLDYDAEFGFMVCKFTEHGFMFYTAPTELMFVPYNNITSIRLCEKITSTVLPTVTIKRVHQRDKDPVFSINAFMNYGSYPTDKFIANARVLFNRWAEYLVNGSKPAASIEQRLRDVENALLYAPPPAAGSEYHDAEGRFERNASVSSTKVSE